MADKFIGFIDLKGDEPTDKDLFKRVAAKIIAYPNEAVASVLELMGEAIRKDGMVNNQIAEVYQGLIDITTQIVAENEMEKHNAEEEDGDYESDLL